MFGDESDLIEDKNIFDIDSEVGDSSTDIDDRILIKNMRGEEKAKRLQESIKILVC